jgi:hypothetical protein
MSGVFNISQLVQTKPAAAYSAMTSQLLQIIAIKKFSSIYY